MEIDSKVPEEAEGSMQVDSKVIFVIWITLTILQNDYCTTEDAKP